MNMTHYMELISQNQPWNLIIFMAIPVILAETVAITELFILFSKNLNGKLRTINKFAGIAVGIYFLGIFLYLSANVVIPLTMDGAWRGIVDVTAVGFYLLGVIPLFGISLLDMGIIYRNKSSEEKLKLHATLVAMFLVVSHVAMISGMLNPSIFHMNSGNHMNM